MGCDVTKITSAHWVGCFLLSALFRSRLDMENEDMGGTISWFGTVQTFKGWLYMGDMGAGFCSFLFFFGMMNDRADRGEIDL